MEGLLDGRCLVEKSLLVPSILVHAEIFRILGVEEPHLVPRHVAPHSEASVSVYIDSEA